MYLKSYVRQKSWSKGIIKPKKKKKDQAYYNYKQDPLEIRNSLNNFNLELWYVISLMFQRLVLKDTSLCFPRKGQIYILKVKGLHRLNLQVFCSLSKCFQLESNNYLTISDGKCSLLYLNVLSMTTRISWFLWEYNDSLFLHIVHCVCV